MSIFKVINREGIDKVAKNPIFKFGVRALAAYGVGYAIYEFPKAAMAVVGYVAYELYVSGEDGKK